jgi:DNA-binding transcriptional LysR family regulator
MDLKQLRCFVAVAEELHFGRAAERLHMASTALGRQIRVLEEDLDVRLFSRTTRSVVLTRAGAVFLDEARDILSRTKSAAHIARAAAAAQEDELRIGALDTAAADLLPNVLLGFRARYPHVRIQLLEWTTSKQLQGLVSGRLDIGFLRPPVNEPELQWEFLLQEKLLVAMPADHPLAAQRLVDLRSLLEEPLILPTRKARPCTYNLVMRYFEGVGVRPNVIQEAAEKQTIVSMVAAGIGLALVPEWVAKLRVPGVVYQPLDYVVAEPPPPEALLGVCWRKHQRLSVRDHFLEFLRATRVAGTDTSQVAGDRVTHFRRRQS